VNAPFNPSVDCPYEIYWSYLWKMDSFVKKNLLRKIQLAKDLIDILESNSINTKEDIHPYLNFIVTISLVDPENEDNKGNNKMRLINETDYLVNPYLNIRDVLRQFVNINHVYFKENSRLKYMIFESSGMIIDTHKDSFYHHLIHSKCHIKCYSFISLNHGIIDQAIRSNIYRDTSFFDY